MFNYYKWLEVFINWPTKHIMTTILSKKYNKTDLVLAFWIPSYRNILLTTSLVKKRGGFSYEKTDIRRNGETTSSFYKNPKYARR